MGTRHLICVVKNGEYKVAQYGQWDGYPSAQGASILKFLLNAPLRDFLREKLDMVSFATKDDINAEWIACGASPDSSMVSIEVANKHSSEYPQNSRDTGAGILAIIAEAICPLKLINSLDFAADSLFCEWAYVIDFDKNTFEVYEGFNKSPLDSDERFAFTSVVVEHDSYYPVRHRMTFDLNYLPTLEEFLDLLSDDDSSKE